MEISKTRADIIVEELGIAFEMVQAVLSYVDISIGSYGVRYCDECKANVPIEAGGELECGHEGE